MWTPAYDVLALSTREHRAICTVGTPVDCDRASQAKRRGRRCAGGSRADRQSLVGHVSNGHSRLSRIRAQRRSDSRRRRRQKHAVRAVGALGRSRARAARRVRQRRQSVAGSRRDATAGVRDSTRDRSGAQSHRSPARRREHAVGDSRRSGRSSSRCRRNASARRRGRRPSSADRRDRDRHARAVVCRCRVARRGYRVRCRTGLTSIAHRCQRVAQSGDDKRAVFTFAEPAGY
jgi:hypothetical protein